MSFAVRHVANSVLEKSFIEDSLLSHMKLQKMVYCLHGWHLAVTGDAAIDEDVEAWKYGPVIGSLYHRFKHYGATPIDEFSFEREDGKSAAYIVGKRHKEFYEILERVWRKYSPMTALELSTLTHAPGSPWEITRKNGGRFIANDLIRAHYVKLANGIADVG